MRRFSTATERSDARRRFDKTEHEHPQTGTMRSAVHIRIVATLIKRPNGLLQFARRLIPHLGEPPPEAPVAYPAAGRHFTIGP